MVGLNLPAVQETQVLPGRSPGEGNGNPLQYSCLGNAMDRSLAGCSPRCRQESDTTERLTLLKILDVCNRIERILLELNSAPQPLGGSPGGATGKEPACQCRALKRDRLYPRVGRVPWRRKSQPLQGSCLETPPWTEEPGRPESMGHKKADTTKAT